MKVKNLKQGFLKYICCFILTNITFQTLAGGAKVGINGSACLYANIHEALNNTSAGDTLYILPGTYNELLGSIMTDLTLVPSEAAAPGMTGCEQEMLSATPTTVIIDGGGGTSEVIGGLVNISNTATVTFRHIWMRNAKADFGGVIAAVNGSTLILDNVLITDGIAQQAGGIIMLDNSDLQVINNTTLYQGLSNFVGGAIALFDSSMTLADGNIGVSGGLTQAGTNGGGIYADNSVVTFTSSQSKLQYNQADRHGGGLYAINSIVEIINGLIGFNIADDNGGGLYFRNTEVILNNASIDNNSSLGVGIDNGGGGIYFYEGSVAQLRNIKVRNNNSSGIGGGILAVENTELTLRFSTQVVSNLASNLGGGISTRGILTVDDSNFSNNSADSGGGIHCGSCTEINILNSSSMSENHATSGFGGGVYSEVTSDTHVTQITDSELLNNDSFSVLSDQGYGGAIAITGGTLNISSTLIQNNKATYRGGAVHAFAEQLDELNIQISNVVFLENDTTTQQTNDGGGALFIGEADSIVINDSNFESNFAENSGGGAYFRDVEQFEIHNSLFLDNDSTSGGGLFMTQSEGTIKNSRFISNNSTNGFSGGAINMFSGNELIVINSIFDSNTASGGGGAIISIFSNITIDTDIGSGDDQCNLQQLGFNEYCSAFTNNNADQFNGGAIRIIFDGEVNINNTAFIGNNAPMAGSGSAIYASAPSSSNTEVVLNLKNLLIIGNGFMGSDNSSILMEGNNITMDSITVADNNGAPLLVPNFTTEVSLSNSIFFNNSEPPEVTFGATFTRSCNNSQTPTNSSQSMGGNLGNPLFTSTNRGDYRLSPASPSVNTCISGPLKDLDGLFRNDGGLYDQGAFELDGLETNPEISIFVNGFE